jgi:hypothetical protein
MVLPFGWSQFEAANWALVPTLIYWKIGFVSFPLYYLFVKFTHHERIKTNNRCCFIYLQPVFATVFIGLGKDELNLVKNTVNFDICWCLFGNILSQSIKRENRLHMKKLCTTNFYIIINKTDYFKHKMFTFLEFHRGLGAFTIFALF